MERQTTDWEKMFVNHISDKGLLWKYVKLKQLKRKKNLKKYHLIRQKGQALACTTKKNQSRIRITKEGPHLSELD